MNDLQTPNTPVVAFGSCAVRFSSLLQQLRKDADCLPEKILLPVIDSPTTEPIEAIVMPPPGMRTVLYLAKVLEVEAPERHELLSAAGWEVDDQPSVQNSRCVSGYNTILSMDFGNGVFRKLDDVDHRPFIDVLSAARGIAKATKTLRGGE